MHCLRVPCPCWSPMEFYANTSKIAGGVQICDISEDREFAEIKTVQESISGTLQRAQVTDIALQIRNAGTWTEQSSQS